MFIIYIVITYCIYIYMYREQCLYEQEGSGKCSLCGSLNTNKTTCPLNPSARNPNPENHPLAVGKTKITKTIKKIDKKSQNSEDKGKNKQKSEKKTQQQKINRNVFVHDISTGISTVTKKLDNLILNLRQFPDKTLHIVEYNLFYPTYIKNEIYTLEQDLDYFYDLIAKMSTSEKKYVDPELYQNANEDLNMNLNKLNKLEKEALSYKPLVNSLNDIYYKYKILQTDIEITFRNERTLFGNTEYLFDLSDLFETIHILLRNAIDRLAIVDNLQEYQTLVEDFSAPFDLYIQDYEEIKENIKNAGRRCVNSETPISSEPVDEVSENDFIRLSNGACWDIQTLVNYIKLTTNGQNDARPIREHVDYPSDQIWLNNNDYRKIVNHEYAKEQDLHKFIQDRLWIEIANDINLETLNQMNRSGQLLWSRGPIFDNVIREYMNQVQLDEWNVARNQQSSIWELPDRIKYPQTEVAQDVLNIINGPIKTTGIAEMYNYYKELDASEKNALNRLIPDFEYLLTDCYEGVFCVMQMGDQLIQAYNKIAPYKELEVINVPGLPNLG